MKKSDLAPCHVEFYYGCHMHTHEVGPIDEAVWRYHNCDESLVEDDAYYKVWLTTSHPADPADLSSHTNVYYFEKVPKDLLEMKKKVEAYWKSEDPLDV